MIRLLLILNTGIVLHLLLMYHITYFITTTRLQYVEPYGKQEQERERETECNFVFPSRFCVFVFIKKSNILSSVKESFACLNVQRRYMKL